MTSDTKPVSDQSPPASTVDGIDRLQRSIIYGSVAVPIKKPDTDHTHRWTAYVRGAHDEDISTYVRRVTFKLHESFPNPVRNVETAPFEVQETGWGEFQMGIRIVFQDPNTKPLNLTHHLKLYPVVAGTAVEGEGSAPAPTVKTSRPVISEHYEEIIFDSPTPIMRAILLKEPQYQDIRTSPRYQELAKLEAEELRQIDAAIAMVKTHLDGHLEPVTEAKVVSKPNKTISETEKTPSVRVRNRK